MQIGHLPNQAVLTENNDQYRGESIPRDKPYLPQGSKVTFAHYGKEAANPKNLDKPIITHPAGGAPEVCLRATDFNIIHGDKADIYVPRIPKASLKGTGSMNLDPITGRNIVTSSCKENVKTSHQIVCEANAKLPLLRTLGPLR